MALSQKVAEEARKSGAVAEPVEATAEATPTPATGVAGAKTSKSKVDAFKAKGELLRKKLSEDEKKLEGSKSDKVQFICALGDPSRKQARTKDKVSVNSYVVVGYKFKVLEDMTIMKAPYKETYKSPFDVEQATPVAVKAGEIVSLNIMETAMFISKIEFAGCFNGGGKEVTLSAAAAKDREQVLPILKLKDGSIKEGMELIAEMIGVGEGKKGTPQVKEEYKKDFGVLFTKKAMERKKKSTASKAKGESQKNLAAAFRAMFNN